MKIVTEEHHVPARTYTTTKYVADDGKEFDFKDQCIRYEFKLRIDNHPVFKSRIEEVCTLDGDCASLFYIRDDEDLDFLKKHLHSGSWRSDFRDYGAGWYIYYRIDGGDYQDTICLYNYVAYERMEEDRFASWKAEMHERILEKGSD